MSIYEFSDYREFLKDRLPTSGLDRGGRSKLCTHLGCKLSLISQVLNGTTHFSLEHAYATATFLSLTTEETEFFLLLVQHARAGNEGLKQFFQLKIDAILERQRKIATKIYSKSDRLGPKEHGIYYSSWLYAAIHVAVSVPELQNRKSLCKYFKISPKNLDSYLSFLIQAGLVVENGEQLMNTKTRLHLPDLSPIIRSHHLNWRMKAVASMEQKQKTDLHFSSVLSTSRDCAEKIRNLILELIRESDDLIKRAPVENLYCIGVDFFSLEDLNGL